MRDFARRLATLETRSNADTFQRVVIVGPDDQAPPDSDNVHIIRIVGVEQDHAGAWILPHDKPPRTSGLAA